MTDIVDRLRTYKGDSFIVSQAHEAADEIERLRGDYNRAIEDAVYVSNDLMAENAKLREDAAALWMMLDDIDTGGDIAKADDVLYRAIAERSHKRRFEPRYEWVMMEIDKTCLFEPRYWED